MEQEKRPRRKYDKEFILEAVKLVTEQGQSVSQVAAGLGIHENMLYLWKRKYEADPANAFPGKGRMKPEQEKIRQLERELYRVSRERDILKKAVAIFSKDPKTSTDSQ